MLELRIELLSPLTSGSGLNRPGVVDREVAHDAVGLPLIPARRLKGLLRDGYRLLAETGVVTLADAGVIFGRTGAVAGGAIRLQSARLQDAAGLTAWLEAVQQDEELRTRVRTGQVLEVYSEIRKQTAVERVTGSAREDTLRFTRTLKPGLRFVAGIAGLDASQTRTVALAAAAVQQMGVSRNRGLGDVRCEVWQDGQNLTQLALADLSRDEAGTADAEVTAKGAGAAKGETGGAASLLRFRVKLADSAMFPSLATGDPNTVLTHTSIPGASVRGALANRYLHTGRADARFNQLFCSGEVVFLGANPVAGVKRLQPVPHAMREEKETGSAIDVCLTKPERPVKRVPEKWCALDELWAGETQVRVSVRAQMSYHNARAADGRIQRAVGAEPDKRAPYGLAAGEGGALFVYEALDAQQTFEGGLLGPAELLNELRELVPAGEILGLGRSRSAQYGGAAQWEWLGATQELAGREAWNWLPTTAEEGESDVIRVTLLSPVAGWNEAGHPVASFPEDELALALGAKIVAQQAAAVRVSWQGGYLAHQRLPRQQIQMLAAGSTLVYQLDRPVSAAQRAKAEQQSYGGRVEEGFGRVAITAQPAERSRARQLFTDGNAVAGGSVRLQQGDAAWAIAQQLFAKAVDREVTSSAFEAVGQTARIERVSPHLIYRMTGALERGTLAEFGTWMSRMKKTARGQLGDVRVRPRGATLMTLEEYLLSVIAEKPERGQTGWREQARAFSRQAYTGWERVFAENPLGKDEAASQELVRRYLLRYLSALAGTKREQRKEAGAR